MIKLTLDREDYDDYNVFLNELKKALRYKGNILSKQAIGSMDTSDIFRSLLPDYLYYRLFDEIKTPLLGNYTHYINVVEINASGGYFFKDGLCRKYGKNVLFKIFPPVNFFISEVTINGIKSTSIGDNMYSFTMPLDNVEIIITYSLVMPETSTVYWGISLTAGVPNIVNYNILEVQIGSPFSINFDNVDNSGYIWFATELPVILQSANAFSNNKFLITGSFNEVEQQQLLGYTLYIHKWPTEIDTINFYYE